eukprot:TRINITY_DN69078_c0_g1_i1.p2 TRINITY_DN69078_c0_g1~~TRINITY_DN69078_c0_g1_i1.p2  ORF type:complete len:155 (-),score=12.22 TRINITY_DN69078_c0_g1_i1:61-525(-)
MASASSTTDVPARTLYELCARNGFVDGRPVSARRRRRVASAPAILVRPREMTLIIRSMPCSVNEERMESVLREHGFAGSYDYLFLPVRRNGSNLGFGVVNFMQEQDAFRFRDFLVGYRFPGANSTQRCIVTLADIQGREANVRMNARYRRRTVH